MEMINFNFGRERMMSADDYPSGLSSSSGMLTPHTQSLSTPIQARILAEKGLNGIIAVQNQNNRALDLRSP